MAQPRVISMITCRWRFWITLFDTQREYLLMPGKFLSSCPSKPGEGGGGQAKSTKMHDKKKGNHVSSSMCGFRSIKQVI